MSRIYDNWEKLVGAVVRREKDRQLAYCESFSSCCSSDFSSRFSLDHHLQDAAPLGDDACLAGDTLPPPNSKVYSFADLKIATRSFIVSISMHHVLKRPQSGSGLIKPPTSKHDVEYFPLQHGSLAPPKRYKFRELKKITRSFGEKLGEGGYGRVYKGKLGDGRPVAVKVFGAKVDSSSSGEDFMNEFATISRTSHVNVVTLLGFCSQGSKRALVYEFMPNTSLDKFLSHNQSAVATMDLEKLYKIAVGIAKGLEYLHNGCTTRIVHFDIKPQNILLDEDFCPKIADFGLAKLCKKKQSILSSMLGTRGTAGYIAPEVFSRNFGGVSHKSDVYSYGMMLLNMAQQQKVVESNQAEAEVVQSSEDYFPDNIYDEIIRDVGFDESLVIEDGEKETITKMCVVGFWCIQTNPSTRPSMAKVVEMLEGSLKSIQIPPKHYVLKQRQSGSGLIKPPTSKHDVENFLLQHGSLAPKRYKFRELKKITRSFGEKLGEGGYGRVYKGKLGDGRPVAVKVLAKVDSSSGEDFINEVDSISRTSHVNIVTLLGFCSQGSKRALVYEFMPNTSLDKFLSHNQSAVATMDLEKLFKIAVGIGKGLEYLHTGCTTRIVHFDIKPQNILLDEDFCPKIADFGLAKLCKKKQSILSVLGTRGTVGYIAPEVFSRNFGGVSHKSDVYSYGMMLLEMAQQQKVVECDQAEAEVVQSSEDYFPDNIYDEVIRDVGLEDEEKETMTKMYVVGFWCIQTSPSTRPSISKVVEMLEGSLNSIQIPPKPMLCEPLPESSSTQT